LAKHGCKPKSERNYYVCYKQNTTSCSERALVCTCILNKCALHTITVGDFLQHIVFNIRPGSSAKMMRNDIVKV